jgi:DNA-binding IclR family transcriptional regulator
VSHVTASSRLAVSDARPAPLGTLSKAGLVLDLFVEDRAEWGVRELALRLGLSRSTAHSLLSSLEAINLLQRTPNGRYLLGWRLLQLAGGISEAPVLRRFAPEYLRGLSRLCGQSTHLAVWDGREMFFFARSVAKGGVAVEQARPGSTLPAHATASGRVLLGHLPNEQALGRMLAGNLERLTDRTMVDQRALWHEVEISRERELAISREEVVKNVSSLAVPIRGTDGRVVAALGVSMTAAMLDPFLARYRRHVRSVAARLSADVRNASTDAMRTTFRGLAMEL